MKVDFDAFCNAPVTATSLPLGSSIKQEDRDKCFVTYVAVLAPNGRAYGKDIIVFPPSIANDVQVMVTEFFPFAHDECVGPGQRTLSLDQEVPKMDDFVSMLRQLEEAKRLVRAEREAAVARTEDKKTSGSTVDQHNTPEFEAFRRRFREKRAAPKKKKKTVPSDGGEALPLPASSFHTFLK